MSLLFPHLDQHVETGECVNWRRVMLDFAFMQFCDHMVISHSGFGLYGGFLRPTDPEKEFHVYTNPSSMKQDYWNRANLRFVKFETASDLFFL